MSQFLSRLFLLFTMAAVAFAAEGAPGAPGAPAAPGTPGANQPAGIASMIPTFLFLGLMVAFMWFFIIRPQRKEEKRRKEMMDSLKRGDQVVTIGGLHAEVVTVGETTVELKISEGKDGVVAKFNRGAIQDNLTAQKNADAEKARTK